MTELKELAQKASSDVRAYDPSLARMRERCESIRDEALTSLEQEHAKTAKKFEELEKIIESFGKETLLFRESLERVTGHEEFYENELKRRLVEISSQTRRNEGSGEGVEKPSFEAFDTETCNILLITIKDCMDQIVTESKWNVKNNPILEISNFIKQQYKNLEELINFVTNERQLQIDILSIEAEGMEKQLLDIFIFLNRKLVEVQAIEETLKFFNRKFINFADKCEMKWDNSCSGLDATRTSVNEAKDNFIFSCSKMSRISCVVTEQTGDLEESGRALEDAIRRTSAIAEREALENKRMEELFGVIKKMKDSLAKIGEEYCRKVRAISESLETPKQTLETFVRYVENMGFLDDLLKNIAKKYEGGTMVYMSASEQENNSHLEDYKDNETSSIISGGEMSSCQFGDSFSEFCFEINRSKYDKGVRSKNDSVRETGTPLKLGRMTSVFDEVIRKKAEELIENDKGSLKRKLFLKADMNDKLEREGFDWSSVPSEDSLSEVNNDCLVGSSNSVSEEDDEERTM